MLATVVLLAAVAFQSATLPASDIQAAIAEGTRTKKAMHAQLGADEGGNYWMSVRGPYGRIVTAAANAAAKYQSLTAETLPEGAADQVLEVILSPGKPSYSRYSGWTVTPPAKHVIIRAKGGQPIQPTSVVPFPVEWSNALGGKFQGQGVIAKFDLTTIPADGDLEIVAIGQTFEQVKTLKSKDRGKIR